MIDENEKVILCDEAGRPAGMAGKLDAHRTGQLHLAVSVFVFDRQGRMLLQQRQAGKYHSAGQWANACCSHPRAGESSLECAKRRLQEEMGVSCALEPLFHLLYRADVGAGLTEHEFVHGYAGVFDGAAEPDPVEVSQWRWAELKDLQQDAQAQPHAYAPWLRIYLNERRDELAAAALRAASAIES